MVEFSQGSIEETTRQPITRRFEWTSTVIRNCWTQVPGITPITGMIQKNKNRNFIVPGNEGTLIQQLCEMVQSAKTMICVSSFLIQETEFTEALLDTSARGIPVYLLTAREEDLKKPLDEMLEDERGKIEAHVQFLKKIAGRILVRTCDNFHAKYCLVDPLSRSAKGILMTCNANLDPMTGSNIELAVTLTKNEIKGLFSHFLHGFWEMANHELLKPGEFRGVRKEGADLVDLGEVSIPATWAGGATLKREVLALIASAQTSLVLTAWAIDQNEEIINALQDALKRGVSVTIMIKPTVKSSLALQPLIENGAKVIGHERFHAKVALADDNHAILMTANYTRKGLDEGFEAGILLEGGEIQALKTLITAFERSCAWILRSQVSLKDIDGRVLQISKEKNEMNVTEILSEIEVEMPPLTPETLTDLGDPLQEKIVQKTSINKYPGKLIKSINARRKILAPRLPKEAKREERKDVEFPVYRLSKQLYITITRWEDLTAAAKSADKIKARVVLGP